MVPNPSLNPPVVQPEDFIQSICGHSISGGEITAEGMHLFLDDGRVVIMNGTFIVFIGSLEKQTLQ